LIFVVSSERKFFIKRFCCGCGACEKLDWFCESKLKFTSPEPSLPKGSHEIWALSGLGFGASDLLGFLGFFDFSGFGLLTLIFLMVAVSSDRSIPRSLKLCCSSSSRFPRSSQINSNFMSLRLSSLSITTATSSTSLSSAESLSQSS
jgi:hypothetical protein